MEKILDELKEFMEMLESDKEGAPVFLKTYINNISTDLKEIIDKYEVKENV